MFTSLDKAWAALFGAVAFLGAKYFGWDVTLTPEFFTALSVAVPAILVYFVPNKD